MLTELEGCEANDWSGFIQQLNHSRRLDVITVWNMHSSHSDLILASLDQGANPKSQAQPTSPFMPNRTPAAGSCVLRPPQVMDTFNMNSATATAILTHYYTIILVQFLQSSQF